MHVGTVSEVTGCDAGFLIENFDDMIPRLYPLCSALKRKMKDDRERQQQGQ